MSLLSSSFEVRLLKALHGKFLRCFQIHQRSLSLGGPFKGEFNGRKGQGENIELYGFTVATLSDNGKIVNVEAYAKMDPFLQALQGELAPSEIEKGKGLLGSCCPIATPVQEN